MTGVASLPYPIRKVLAQIIEKHYKDEVGDKIMVNDAWYEASRENEKQICVWPEYSEVGQITLEASGSPFGGLETFQVQLFAKDEDDLHIMYKEVKAILTDHSITINPTYDNEDENEFNQETGIEHIYIWREEERHKDKKRGEEVWRYIFWVHVKYHELR